MPEGENGGSRTPLPEIVDRTGPININLPPVAPPEEKKGPGSILSKWFPLCALIIGLLGGTAATLVRFGCGATQGYVQTAVASHAAIPAHEEAKARLEALERSQAVVATDMAAIRNDMAEIRKDVRTLISVSRPHPLP